MRCLVTAVTAECTYIKRSLAVLLHLCLLYNLQDTAMKRVLIVSGLVALMAAGYLAYPTGAPSSVCDEPFMEPIFHRDNLSAVGHNNSDLTNPYTLQAKPVQGSPDLILVTLSGATFKGFVVRAATPDQENLGAFIEAEDDIPFNTLHCATQEYVAVTHANPDPKPSITLKYQNSNNVNPVFQATVVPDIESYVINIFES